MGNAGFISSIVARSSRNHKNNNINGQSDFTTKTGNRLAIEITIRRNNPVLNLTLTAYCMGLLAGFYTGLLTLNPKLLRQGKDMGYLFGRSGGVVRLVTSEPQQTKVPKSVSISGVYCMYECTYCMYAFMYASGCYRV